MVKCLFCNHRKVNPVDQCKPRFAQSYGCDMGQVNNKECPYFKSDEVIDVDWTEVKQEEIKSEEEKNSKEEKTE